MKVADHVECRLVQEYEDRRNSVVIGSGDKVKQCVKALFSLSVRQLTNNSSSVSDGKGN